jgi:hypothetical protein
VAYAGVAAIGELVSYSLDFGARTYSYTIRDSAFGLAGITRSGSLQQNTDGTWTPSGMASPAAKFLALDSGLLLGAIREDFGTGAQTVPVVAAANPIGSLADAAGVYNFIEYPCVARMCEATWGTVRVNADGTWQSCTFSDFSAACPLASSGSFNALGGGRWQATQAGIGVIGSAMMFRAPAGGQKLILLDFASPFMSGFSIALEQRAIAPSDYDARSWLVARYPASAYTTRTLSAAGTSFTLNSPFAGFAITSTGEHALVAATGLYVAAGNGFVDVGVALPSD